MTENLQNDENLISNSENSKNSNLIKIKIESQIENENLNVERVNEYHDRPVETIIAQEKLNVNEYRQKTVPVLTAYPSCRTIRLLENQKTG